MGEELPMNNVNEHKSIMDPERDYSKTSMQQIKCQVSNSNVMALPIFVFAILIVAVFGLSWTYHSYIDQKSEVCLTEDCLRSATLIVEAMNRSVDPCDDFYQFACGRYGNMHRIPEPLTTTNRFFELDDVMLINTKEFLEKEDDMDEPDAVKKSRDFYRSCMTQDEIDHVDMDPLMTILKKIGLSDLEFIAQNTDDKNQQTFTSILAKTKKLIDLDYLFEVQITPSVENSKINIITLFPSEFYDLLQIPDAEKNMNIIQEIITNDNNIETDVSAAIFNLLMYLMKYVEEISNIVYTQSEDSNNTETFQNTKLVSQITSDILDFYMKLVLIQAPEDDENVSVMTFNELQIFTDNITLVNNNSLGLTIDWKEYLTILYEDVENITLNFETDLIQLYNEKYFTNLFHLLRGMERTNGLTNAWWYVVSSLLQYTTDDMRFVQSSFGYKIYGINTFNARPYYCANTVASIMATAVSNLLPKMKSIKRNKLKIIELVKNIQWAFENSVEDLMWMDDDTKNMTLFKAQRMKMFVGYPEVSQIPEALDDYYSDFEVRENDFFGNVIRHKQRSVRQNLILLRKKNSKNACWRVNPLSVNAYYTISANSITVPGGILQLPFFGHDVQVLNYGLFGSILGHELTHGFDNVGRHYDYNGNLQNWWSNQTESEFDKRAECFIRHYGSYTAPLSGEKLDGNKTLNENIADNGGLRKAFWAYRKYVNDHGEEPKLPGLENFSNEQVFFLSFANIWCESNKVKATWEYTSDEHSPNYIRVIGTLINSEEFAKVWKCKKGSRMNPPEKKCKIW